MDFCRKTILLLIFSSLMSVGWGQDCPENMFWWDCGSMCEPTCSNPEIDPDIICPGVCVEGCFCNSGFIFLYDNYWDQYYNICIPIEDCPEEPPCDEEIQVELWGECYNIEETTNLYLQNSGLTGEIPSTIGGLINLERLWLHNNQLTGSIPPEIGDLINLQELILKNNQLTGGIPQELGNLQEILYFDLSFNPLGGSIPSEIWNLETLGELWLVENNLVGDIPSDVGNLINLRTLYLGHNQLNGELPSNLWELDIEDLYLSDNLFSGEIPPEIGYMENLGWLYLDNNQFTSISENICLQDSTLIYGNDVDYNYYLNLGDNIICNNVPDCMYNSPGFNYSSNIIIFEDDLIIYNSYQPQNCEEFICNEETEVELWGECYNIENTTFLNYSFLEGSEYPPLFFEIPPEIGQLVNLTELYLGGNYLTVIPPEIGNLVNLQSLFLYGNYFTSIPSEIGNLVNLTTLDIGYNQITELPVEVYSLNNLEVLRLEHNQLTSLSNDLCNLSDCNIYINNNQICPPYPECLSEDNIGEQDTSECVECSDGDINGDYTIDVLDVVIMVDCILINDCIECSDITGDGDTNVLDIVYLVDYILN